VVSIAESLNYRIFERKWRPGEALNSLPRACRILSVEQKPNLTKEPWFVGESPLSLAIEWLPRVPVTTSIHG
jgi:hypothetical protein